MIEQILKIFNRNQKNYKAATFWTDYTTQQTNTLDQFEHWTFKAIDIKAKAISAINFEEFNNLNEIVENSQIKKDLLHFNEIIGWTQAIYLSVVHLSLTGASYWYIKQSETKNYKYEFYPLNPQKIKAVPNKLNGLPEFYEYKDGVGNVQRLLLSEVLSIYNPDPTDWLKAYSPLLASRYAHNIVEFAMRYNQNLFGNMGSLQGFMIFENIADDERQRVEEIMKEKYTGTRNAGKVGVINRKFEWLELGKAPKELEFLGSYEAMRDTVLAIQGVPKDMIVGGSTYENAKEAQRIFQLYTIKPLIEQIQNAINRQLTLKYNNQSLIVFDNPIEADKKVDTEIVSKQYQSGIITLNEARQALGYPVIDGGDDLINSNKKQKEIINKIENIIQTFESEQKTKEIDEIREKLRTELNQKQLETETEVKKFIQNTFKNQEKRILKSIKNKKNININFFKIDWNKEDLLVSEDLKVIIDYIVEIYQNQVSEFLNVQTRLNEQQLQELQKQQFEIIKLINQTTQKDLQKLINNAIVNNLTIDDLTAEIQKLYSDYSVGRAETIARTETTRIKSFTQKTLYEESEAVDKLQWLSAKDKNTRLEHAQADGQIVNKGEKFFVGGEFLDYPGDRKGKPHNTINCRCDVIPIVK